MHNLIDGVTYLYDNTRLDEIICTIAVPTICVLLFGVFFLLGTVNGMKASMAAQTQAQAAPITRWEYDAQSRTMIQHRRRPGPTN